MFIVLSLQFALLAREEWTLTQNWVQYESPRKDVAGLLQICPRVGTDACGLDALN
jgi:hypothetical protein